MIRPLATLLGLGALLCLAAPAAHAQRFSEFTGEQIVPICTGSNQLRAGQCLSFINGVADSAELYQDLQPQDGSKGGKLPAYICVPPATTGVSLRDTVVKYTRSHPETKTYRAARVVLDALYAAYPCKS